MATAAIKVAAEPRKAQGSIESRRLRREGLVPAVVYGVGKAPQNVQINEHTFKRTLRSHTSEHVLIDLEIGPGDVRKVLLQEVQHHPLTGGIVHVDFQEISMTQKLRIKIPLRLVGDPVGVTLGGGVLEYLVRDVEVECLPGDIVERLDVDVSALAVGHSLHAGQIPLDAAKYRLLTDKDLAIAAVSLPRQEEEETKAAEAVPGEPEVLREKKPEEGEAEAGAAKAGEKAPAKGAEKAPAKGAEKAPAKEGKK